MSETDKTGTPVNFTWPKNPNTQDIEAELEGFETTLRSGEAEKLLPAKNPSTMAELLRLYVEPPKVFCLGIDHESGYYFRPPATNGRFAWSLTGKRVQPGGGREPRVGVDPDDLAQAGWGVMFADDSARAALHPLLELRQRQARDRYTEFQFQPGQSAQAFLNQHHAPPGPADPERAVPYYLTIVGAPEVIPFEFQQELDVRYAVGRISFDRPEDCARYATAVVEAENGESPRSKEAVYFGVEHPTDAVTRLCTKRLVGPLAEEPTLQLPGWRNLLLTGQEASHDNLTDLLGGSRRPALLLTAGHGLVVSKDSDLQRPLQGALLTSEWPGPGTGTVRPEQLFSSADLTDRTDVAGLIAVLVGCFTAGTPRFDSFAEGEQIELAKSAFVADFAKSLLARGALAALGHVDSLYIHSYAWPGAGNLPQHQTFETMLYHLMAGRRLGHAMDTFGRKYGELAARLLAARLDPGQVSEEEYSSCWIGYHDARQYVVLGDPAVRLVVPAPV